MKRNTSILKAVCLLLFFMLPLFSRQNIYGAENPFLDLPDSYSASYSEGAASSILNPVFAGITATPMISYRYLQYSSENDANHLFNLHLAGFSLTYGWFDNIYSSESDSTVNPGINYYNISKGFHYGKSFGIGVGYSFSDSHADAYDRYRSWSLGLLMRPIPYLSIGVALNDMGASIGGEKLRHRETYSVSFRPYTERLTLSADAVRLSGNSLDEMDWLFGAELRAPYDITLSLRSDLSSSFTFGITVPLHFRAQRASTMLLDYRNASNSGKNSDYQSFGLTIPFEQYTGGVRFTAGTTLLGIRLDRDFLEIEREGFLGKTKVSYIEILNGIREAAGDSAIDGIIMEIDYSGLGFAQIQELRQEIINFRKSGKKVYCVIAGPGNKEYYLAAASDRIYYTPNSLFSLTGLKASVYFFKGLMAKLGISFEAIRHGKYKSVFESFTREHLSPEARENLVSLLKDLNDQFVSDIAFDRKISVSEVETLFDKGGVSPEEAVKMGFIDKISYYDDALKDIAERTTVVRFNHYISEKEKDYSWGAMPAIAVIHAGGSIVRGKSSGSAFNESLGDDTYSEMLTSAFKDRNVKAIVIRVSTGGGSALASDFMQRKLVELQKQYKKPVVFSFGNMAASGGYYIACTGNPILANPGTLTGSIGVISGKLTLKELYEKLGINKDTVKMSELADIMSESKDLTDRERALIQKDVDYIYDQFTGKVVQFRGIPENKIPDIAEGRVFSGKQASKNGLVDRTGGLIAAIELAGEKAGLSHGYELRILPDREFLLSELLESEDMKVMAETIRPLIRNSEVLKYKNERTLYYMPYRIEIE